MYSYTALEGLIRCPMVNADRIHDEWQNLQVGDPVKLCAGDFAPPPPTSSRSCIPTRRS